MDNNRKAALRNLFSVLSAVFFIIYLIFMLLSFLRPQVPMFVYGCMMLFWFLFIIIQNAIVEKAEELGTVSSGSLLSLPFFTYLMLLCYIIMEYALKIDLLNNIFWTTFALLNSFIFDKSMRVLRKLKQE